MLFSLALLSLGGLEEAGFPHLPLHAVSFELYPVCSCGAGVSRSVGLQEGCEVEMGHNRAAAPFSGSGAGGALMGLGAGEATQVLPVTEGQGSTSPTWV